MRKMVCIIEKLQMLTMGAINAIASILIPSLCLMRKEHMAKIP